MIQSFDKVLNIGIGFSANDLERKKIRLINGIGFISCIVLFFTTITVYLVTGPFYKPDWQLYYQYFIGTTYQKAQIITKVKLMFPILDAIATILSGSLL